MLIVDDVVVNREVLKLLFQEEYTILEAENGREAMDIMEACQGNVDIVLLDLIMPDMSGLIVLEKRKHLDYFREVPVVVITGSDAHDDQIQAFNLGANDYINKPFIPEIVISRVNNVMASHRRMLTIELEAEKLKVKSELDQMTGLYNKTTVEYMIEETLTCHPDQLHALIVIDIDNFKSVNDISGHLEGDHTIRIVADLISSLFRKTDIIGRIGGDEFVVLMVDVGDKDIIRLKVNELTQIMKYKPNLTIPENVSLSMGFTTNERQPILYQELFEKADQALYIAKKLGKARYQEYGVEIVENVEEQKEKVLLISRDRGVCSVINSMAPDELKIIEALTVSEIHLLSAEDADKLVLIYADVSDEADDAQGLWDELMAMEWSKKTPILAICQEGNMKQFMTAMQAGVNDILTAPLEASIVKRRTLKLLEKK